MRRIAGCSGRRCSPCHCLGSPANSAGSSPNSAVSPGAIGEVLPTFLGTSSLTTTDLIFSLTGFLVLYTCLLIVEAYLMFKFARLGPSSLGTGRLSFRDIGARHRPVSQRQNEETTMFDYETAEVYLVDPGRRAADRLCHHRWHGYGRRFTPALHCQDRCRSGASPSTPSVRIGTAIRCG